MIYESQLRDYKIKYNYEGDSLNHLFKVLSKEQIEDIIF